MLLGLNLAGWSNQTTERNCQNTNMERFTDKYYVTPEVCEQLFKDIQRDDNIHKIKKPNPKCLLLALFYLKKYPTKRDMGAFLDMSENTAMSQSRDYVKSIQGMKDHKIRWIFDEDDNNLDEMFTVSVDGVHCRIQEPRCDPGSKWYSKKFNAAGLVYEIAIAIWHNQLVWVNGPFPAGQNDWTVFAKEDGLRNKMPVGKKAVADKIYRYDREKVGADNEHDTKAVAKFKGRAKARQEVRSLACDTNTPLFESPRQPACTSTWSIARSAFPCLLPSR